MWLLPATSNLEETVLHGLSAQYNGGQHFGIGLIEDAQGEPINLPILRKPNPEFPRAAISYVSSEIDIGHTIGDSLAIFADIEVVHDGQSYRRIVSRQFEARLREGAFRIDGFTGDPCG